jgi:peptidyl-prolyl cis-trans isomerase SurA
MKRIILSLIVLSTIVANANGQKDPVVLTINDEKVTKSEFLQIYLKNNNDPQFDKASLDEYIELFKRFKLKVEAAKELGYDTIPSIRKELDGYREQLSRPYLVDSAKNQAIVKEAYDRYQAEINASHILVRVDQTASPEDTLKAFNKIKLIKSKIEKGEDFHSVDIGFNPLLEPREKNIREDLGYFTVFQMVYPFENMAYNTPVGKVSDIVRTRFGYHIIQVNDKRAARGTMTAAHIMIAMTADADKSDVQNAEKKINEIYEKLEGGDDFAKLARLYSDDRSSKQKGGRLPAFGSGTSQRMIPEFEDAAFGLKEDGAYSKPFRTNFGYHVVQRIAFKPIGDLDELNKMLQTKVNKDMRGEKTRKYFVEKLKKENKFKDKSSKRISWFEENLDSSVFKGKWDAPEIQKDKWLFKYDKKKYFMSDFREYFMENQRGTAKKPFPYVVQNKFEDWVHHVIIEDEKSKLENKYPEFKALMNEYHDGVLLYEIMKNQVWDKAIEDTSGLKAFFEKNQSDYLWPDRVHVNIYTVGNDSMAGVVYQVLKDSSHLDYKEALKIFNKDSQLNVNFKNEKINIDSDDFKKYCQNKEIGVRSPIKNEDSTNQIFVVNVLELLEQAPKSLREARGNAIQDYQNYLETKWLEELQSKYIITVNEEVLYSLGK